MENSVTINVSEKAKASAITIQGIEVMFNAVMQDHGLLKGDRRVEAYDHRLSFEIERVFGVNCRIYYRNEYVLNMGTLRQLAELNPDLRVVENHPVVELGWSSNSRSISNAMVCIDLYERMTKAAADFEARISEFKYVIA